MINRLNKLLLVLSTALILSVPQIAAATDDVVVVEKPSALAMTGDLILARPVLFVMTAVGSVIYIASLPFSLAGGNAAEAGKVLVLKPAHTTFVRCLGCKLPGYKKTVEEVEGSN
jgi:hypothetical protein